VSGIRVHVQNLSGQSIPLMGGKCCFVQNFGQEVIRGGGPNSEMNAFTSLNKLVLDQFSNSEKNMVRACGVRALICAFCQPKPGWSCFPKLAVLPQYGFEVTVRRPAFVTATMHRAIREAPQRVVRTQNMGVQHYVVRFLKNYIADRAFGLSTEAQRHK